jgi:hypothetical protein
MKVENSSITINWSSWHNLLYPANTGVFSYPLLAYLENINVCHTINYKTK